MMITNYIINNSHLKMSDEISNTEFKMFNTGGVECEVGELLYTLTKIYKPELILETGTHFGISTSYFALALKHNKKGKIYTIDINEYEERTKLFDELDINDYIIQNNNGVEKFETNDIFDIILLDTEPCLRFNEFDRFYKNLKDGGLIIIHDLHSNLSFNKEELINGIYHWPFGDFRNKLKTYILDEKVQILSLPTPRGITIFQKPSENMSYIKNIL